MTEAEERYLYKWDELNALETMLSVGGYSTSDAREKFRDSLVDGYIEGFGAAEYMLDHETDIDEELLELALTKSYDGVSIYDKFDTYYDEGDGERLKVLMDNEFHRAYGQGARDASKGIEAETGLTVYKTWQTMRDPRVRPTHDYLEGTKIPIDQAFVTYDMDEAMFPGDFSLPENVVGCRCYLTYSLE